MLHELHVHVPCNLHEVFRPIVRKTTLAAKRTEINYIIINITTRAFKFTNQ